MPQMAYFGKENGCEAGKVGLEINVLRPSKWS